MNETQEEILARLIRIESKLGAFMEAQGLNTHGKPIARSDEPVTHSDERQPMSNAPRDPFVSVVYRGAGYKYGQRN